MKIAYYVFVTIALLSIWIPLAWATKMPKISLILAGGIVGGASGFLSSLFNWDSFFEMSPVDRRVARFGRKKVRASYCFGGLLLLVLSAMFAWFIVNPTACMVYTIYFYLQIKKLFPA